jgi:hypothetical protein
MKKPFPGFTLFLCLLAAHAVSAILARADSTLVFGEVDAGGQVATLTQQIHLRDGVMSLAAADSKRLMIFNARTSTAYVVDHQEKKYISFDPEKVAKMAENFAQTQEQVLGGLEGKLAELPKEERERLQGFMDKLHQVAAEQMQKEPERKYVDTGKSAEVGEWKAQVVEVLEDGEKKSTLYMVDYRDIGLSRGEYETLVNFQAYIERIANNVPAGLRKNFGDFRMLTEAEKVPVQVTRLDPKSGEETTERLANVIREPIEEGWFTVPEGYERDTLGL